MSLLSFKEIRNYRYFDLSNIVKEIDNYLAHLPKIDSAGKETLLKHSNLVLDYSLEVIKANKLEKLIDKAISILKINQRLSNDAKNFFLKAIYWHDIGKINENFQVDKMQNYKFSKTCLTISSKHSVVSSYLYLSNCAEYILNNYKNSKERIVLISIVLFFSFAIWRHHSGLNKSLRKLLTDKDEGIPACEELSLYLDIIQPNISKNIHSFIIDNLVKGDVKEYLIKDETYFILTKTLFSLLIISDYYATAQFMNYGNIKELKYNDFGLISDNFRKDIYAKFYENQYMITPLEKTSDDFKAFKELQEKSNDNLNHLRNKLFIEVRENLKKNFDKNLFYIEAPTGAGKTNLSMLSIVEILKERNDINKVFYVFPFTVLITQTYIDVKDKFALNNSEIAQLHSKAEYNKKEENQDGLYGDEKTNFIDNQFMNYPITLLSHVKFFNILTGISKDDNYIFHRLANSVVIIDEIQTYNPIYWSKIVYLLDVYAKNFNIKFIVMSATLPKIGDIIDSKFCFLVSNKQEYFQNPNFAKRVEIITEVINIKNAQEIYPKLIDDSKKYQKTNETGKVRTLIEFITKKGADEFYKYAKSQKNFFDEIFILSGTILESRRKEIIDYIKNNEDKNILLVSTQVVEAGVDIDMDIGFKEKSLVDSDEQLAGRLNRNSSKENNKLFLFKIGNGNENFVYKDDKRKNLSPTYEENGESKNVLITKDFDKYYSHIIEQMKKENKNNFMENIETYKADIKNLRFNNTHIELINMKSLSVFVPIDENAESIWLEYKSIIKNEEMDFIDKKISLKELSSQMSKYTFSLADYKNSGLNYLKDYGEEKYGYLYLTDWQSEKENGERLYSYKDGLDTSVLKDEWVDMIL